MANLDLESVQGDIDFLSVLARMGCRLTSVSGRHLRGGRPPQGHPHGYVGHAGYLVPTLAVLAAFAEGETVVTGVAHLRHKESNRLAVW